MAQQGIKYAEDVLEVHQAYIAARDAGQRADVARQSVAIQRESRALILEVIAQREATVANDMWASHTDWSATKIEKMLRVAITQDADLKAFRADLRNADIQIDVGEVQAKQADTDVRIYTARMTELGGYLQYLAALKVAATTTTPTQTETSS